MKNNYKISLIILIAIILWIVLGYFLPGEDSHDKQDKTASFNKRDLQLVKLKEVEPKVRRKEITLIGTTQPSREIDIISEVSGKITKIHAREGSKVEKGQVLISIEKRNRDAKVKELEAKVEEKRITYEAARKLSKSGLQSKSRLAQQKSELEQAKANLIQARIDLDNTDIESPFDGILQKVDVEEGDFIQIGFGGASMGGFGSEVMAKVIDNKPFIVTAGVTERLIGKIELGSKAEIELVSGQSTEGKVSYISRVANPETRTFEIEIEVNDDNIDVASGITATIKLPIEERLSYNVPSSSLSLNKEGNFGIKYFIQKEADKESQKDQIKEGQIFGEVGFKEISIYDSGKEGLWIDATEQDNISQKLNLITRGSAFVEVGDKVLATFN